MSAIRRLPPDLAAKIAAGEVVERPASVVKELVENALDAGARRVAVELTGGGLEAIRVTDDGCGIPPEDLPAALERHATSKLASEDDLYRIQTLGFRGEALPSIAAAADVEVVTRTPDRDAGARLTAADGRTAGPTPAASPPGTSVTVRRLFQRQPARRKFLKPPQAEAQQAAQLLTHYALAYPEVRFTLSVDGRRVLETPGNGDLRDALAAVYGAETAAAMLAIEPGWEGESAAAAGVRVGGLVSPPHVSRATRAYLHLFVNRRWIQDRRLAYAVEEAYQHLLERGRHPIAVIDLRLPPEEVDVNVHPAKWEVRFRQERLVFAAVQRAVRHTVAGTSPVPAFRLAPGPPPAAGPAPGAGPAAPPPLWQHAVALEQRAAAPRPEPGPDGPAPPAPRIPILRVVGLTAGTYVVAEGPDGMYLIDQHAAHERVLFERIRAQRTRQAVEVQGLLDAPLLELTPRQAAVLEGHAAVLAEHGFGLEPFGERSYRVRAVPAVLAGKDPLGAVTAFLDRLGSEEPGVEDGDRVAATLACHGSVRAGMSLTMDEMRELVRLLEAAESPRTCPHGRPTMLHLSASALEREFRRR
ncbi:MAG TPA: DNA mismatch repair endonuclease MutL [Dehalococcoidia bacterium]